MLLSQHLWQCAIQVRLDKSPKLIASHYATTWARHESLAFECIENLVFVWSTTKRNAIKPWQCFNNPSMCVSTRQATCLLNCYLSIFLWLPLLALHENALLQCKSNNSETCNDSSLCCHLHAQEHLLDVCTAQGISCHKHCLASLLTWHIIVGRSMDQPWHSLAPSAVLPNKQPTFICLHPHGLLLHWFHWRMPSWNLPAIDRQFDCFLYAP